MNHASKKPFLPSKAEIKEIVGILLITITHMVYHFACLLPLILFRVIPAGDQLPQVALRILAVALVLALGAWMLKGKEAIFFRLFGNIVSDEVIASYAPPSGPEASSLKAAIEQNWHLLIVAALMLTVVSGAVDFASPWADGGRSWGRYQSIYQLLEWLHTNPNTTRSLAWLMGVGSLSLCGYRLRGARIRQMQLAKLAEFQKP